MRSSRDGGRPRRTRCATMRPRPLTILSFVEAQGRACLASEQAVALVPAQEVAEGRIVVAGRAPSKARDVAQPHHEAADDARLLPHPIDRARRHVREAGAHEVLTPARAQASSQDAPLARTHRPEVHEAKLWIVPATCDPPEHSAAMAVDAVPHHLAYETTDFEEALDAVELRRPDRGLVAAVLAHEAAVRTPVVGLPAACADPRLSLHPRHQKLEIARGKVEVEVELANVVELTRIDRFVSGIERLDHAGTDAATSAVLAADDADEVEARG